MDVTKEELAAIREIVKRADVEKPKPADIAALQRGLRDYPTLWRMAGDVAEQAELNLLETVTGPLVWREAVRYGLQAQRRDLGYDTAPLLERLLIDQVVICWLRHNLLEYHYTQKVMSSAGYNTETGDYWERRLSASQRRYLRALETLARVRRLAQVTPLQVNIAGQQVNVAGGVSVEQGQGAIAHCSAPKKQDD